jgi:hypothetical protein
VLCEVRFGIMPAAAFHDGEPYARSKETEVLRIPKDGPSEAQTKKLIGSWR